MMILVCHQDNELQEAWCSSASIRFFKGEIIRHLLSQPRQVELNFVVATESIEVYKERDGHPCTVPKNAEKN